MAEPIDAVMVGAGNRGHFVYGAYALRHPDQLGLFLDGLEVLEPGLVPCTLWRPSPDDDPALLRDVDEYGAVARKR